MAGQDIARILHPDMPLEQALEQIADHRGEERRQRDRQHQRLLLERGAGVPGETGRGEQRAGQAAEQALDRLVRADPWRQLVPAESAPGEVGAGVAGPDDRQRHQQPAVPVRLRGMQQRQCAPGGHHRQGAGSELEHARMGVVVGGELVVLQPQAGQQPPDHADHHHQLEQHQAAAAVRARSPGQRHHHQQVHQQQHGTRQRIVDFGQLEPFPQPDQEQGRRQRDQPRRGQQQDAGDRERRHGQGGEHADPGHASALSEGGEVRAARTWSPVSPKRRSRPA